MQALLNWLIVLLQTHAAQFVWAQGALAVVAGATAVFKPKWLVFVSKAAGTLSILDLGRLVRQLIAFRDVMSARKADTMKNTIKTSLLFTMLLAVSLGTSACASAIPSTTSAQSANGKNWPLCVEVDFTTSIPIVQDWSVMACATTNAALASAKEAAIKDFKVQHPDATLVKEAAIPATMKVSAK